MNLGHMGETGCDIWGNGVRHVGKRPKKGMMNLGHMGETGCDIWRKGGVWCRRVQKKRNLVEALWHRAVDIRLIERLLLSCEVAADGRLVEREGGGLRRRLRLLGRRLVEHQTLLDRGVRVAAVLLLEVLHERVHNVPRW